MFRLAHFINAQNGREFVVILSPHEKIEEFGEDGFELREVLDIDGDASQFPCDRALIAE